MKRRPVELHSWDGFCLGLTGGGSLTLPTIQFTDPQDDDGSNSMDKGQPFGDRSWHNGYSYGWQGTQGICRFDDRTGRCEASEEGHPVLVVGVG